MNSAAHWIVRMAVILGGGFNLLIGLWALAAPRSFYESIAIFPPYNQHFLHDVGVFQIGLGLSLLLALMWSDALTVVLVAAAIANVLHLASHLIDRSLGGRPTDYLVLGGIAAALVLAAAIRLGRGGTSTEGPTRA